MEEMTFGKAIKTCFKKYCVFKGRATRAEFWYWFLFTLVVSIGISVLQGFLAIPALIKGTGTETMSAIVLYITLAWGLVTLLPTLSVSVRRLHDTSHSGWWLLIVYVLEIAGFSLLFGNNAGDILAGRIPDATGMNPTCVSIGGILLLVYFCLAIVLLIFFVKKSTPAANKYGPCPKEELVEAEDEGTTVPEIPEEPESEETPSEE